MSVWTSREDAERADAVTKPQFEQALGDLLEGSIETHIHEIYEHKQ